MSNIYISLALTISAGIGFVYGLFRFFRKESVLYVRMIVLGIGCAMLGRLFGTLLYHVNGEFFNGFNVGMLGIIGSFLFFFSANFGQIDSVVDNGSKKFLKARIIALAAPISIAALWCLIFAVFGVNDLTVWVGLEALSLAIASYFHLKHLIMKDDESGILRALRVYNLLSLIYAALCLMEVIEDCMEAPAFVYIIVCVLECVVMLAFVPVLERGVKKWTT